MLTILAGLLSLLIWVYLLTAWGGFWRVSRMYPPPVSPEKMSGPVVAVIPARNEAEVIAPVIASLLGQTRVASIHIFLVDDGSSDGTAAAAQEAAARAGKAEDLTVITGRPLPPGWTGKLWAVQQGIERAREMTPEFFLLADADVVHSPENVSTLAAVAEGGAYDLVSLMVRLRCTSTAEKFLVPAFVFFFFMLYPPPWVRDPKRRTAGAAGGCVLVRPGALERAGGIAAIRGEIIDDCALARAVKAGGGRLWLGLTESAVSVRPYPGFADIGRMISRTAFNQLRHSAVLLLLALAGLTVTYLLPPLLLFSGKVLPSLMGVAAWLLMALAYLPIVRFYGLGPQWALTLPAVAVFYMGATVHSAVRYWTGSGGQWKGRVQDKS